MHKPWSEAEGALLKRLREEALLAPAAFAKRHALSNGQLRELEQGGQGSFYSEDIKAYNGRKLLKTLGYTAPIEVEPETQAVPAAQAVPDQAVQQTSAFTSEPERPEPAVEPAVAQSVDEPANTPLAQDDSMPPQAGEVTPAPVAGAADTAGAAPAGAAVASQRPAGGSVWPLAALAVLGAVGVLWATSTSRSPAPESVPQVPVNAAPASADLPPASAPPSTASAAAAASAPASASPASAPASAQAQSSANKLPAGCEPAKGSVATAYQSPIADRPETYVHVESLGDVQVCVVDAQNRPTLLNLKAGQSQTIQGAAPFAIRTTQWQNLKVFFQGMRVQLEPGQPTDQVVLNPRRGA